MILEAVLILLGAQIADASQPEHGSRLDELPSAQFAPSISFPTIDEVARQSGAPATPYPTENPFSLAGYAPKPMTMVYAESLTIASNEPPSDSLIESSNESSYLHEPVTAEMTLAPMASAPQRFIPPAAGGRVRHWLGRRSGSDYGLGYDRVMLAPITTETALGIPQVALQFRYQRGASSPDRLEYVWARAGKGPAAETGLDMLDTVFRTELGNARAVVISEISMRSLDPERAPNTTGFGDMVVGGKSVMYEGSCTKISTIFLTYLNTGPVDRGLGTGHVSLEPGLLGMQQWTERTYLHGALQYRIPIAGERGFAGDVLRTSWAISTLWQDSDTYAWMPVLEFQTHSFLFGKQTEPGGAARRVDGTTAFDIMPGSRFAFGGSSLGACEVGLSGGFRCSDVDWFDSRMTIEMRWLR